MVSEPSNAELGRRLDQIYGSLQALIGRPEYEAGLRGVEHRLDDLDRSDEDLRRRIDAEVKALHERISAEAKASAERNQWRTNILVGLIPALVAVAAILVTIWLHGSSG